jgi:hypothetical protein
VRQQACEWDVTIPDSWSHIRIFRQIQGFSYHLITWTQVLDHISCEIEEPISEYEESVGLGDDVECEPTLGESLSKGLYKANLSQRVVNMPYTMFI